MQEIEEQNEIEVEVAEPEEVDTEAMAEAKADEEILATARKRFLLCEEAEADIRRLADEDQEFAAGEQWSQRDKSERDRDGRPRLVINRMPQFIHQITNDLRQNRPAIKVSPVDDHADVDTAKILQGLVRSIENVSNADTAYDRGGSKAVIGGIGYIGVECVYADPHSFDQELRVISVLNPATCYLDPTYTEPDGSDANYGFKTTDLSIDDFNTQFPDAEVDTSGSWEPLGNDLADWIKKDTVRIADYYYKKFERKTLVQLSTGESVLEEKLPKAPGMMPPGTQIVRKRLTQIPVVHHLKIKGAKILERTIFPGPYIPIIPVLGEELNVKGKRVLEGIVRHAKDPQRMFNYSKSAEAETIALAPRSPWIGVEGQFEGFEDKWQTANRQNHAYLEYKAKSIAGVPVGPPQRNVFEPPVQAVTHSAMMSAEDMKATTGIYDAGLGAQSNETSGKAINARRGQTQTSNFHFVDNLSKSIRHLGRILVAAIPIIYDSARAIRILGETGEEEIVRIHEFFDRNGEQKVIDFSIGKYDVSVNVGPSFETKRQEAVASQVEMSRANPKMMDAAGDIIIGNMDWPGAKEIAERLKKTMPPELTEDSKANQKIPPQLKAMIDQLSKQNEILTKSLNEKSQIIETKSIELESKERIEMQKLQVQLQIEMAKIDATDARLVFASEIKQLESRLNQLGQNQPIGAHEDPDMDQGGQEQMENEPAGNPAAQGFEQPTGGFSPENSGVMS